MGYGAYGRDSEVDPHGSMEAGAERVFRGGSWSSEARGCRAAYRDWGRPDLRNDNLGFRCARVQE